MSKIQKFVDEACKVADDDSHGYSQINRWGPDYDCSSLVYHCAYVAGYDVPKSGTRYTGTIMRDFEACGWRVDAFDGNLTDLDVGDILLNVKNHVAIYIGDMTIVEASIDESGGIEGRIPGDQTGHEIHRRSVYSYPWDYVLTAPVEGDDGDKEDASEITRAIQLIEQALSILKSV